MSGRRRRGRGCCCCRCYEGVKDAFCHKCYEWISGVSDSNRPTALILQLLFIFTFTFAAVAAAVAVAAYLQSGSSSAWIQAVHQLNDTIKHPGREYESAASCNNTNAVWNTRGAGANVEHFRILHCHELIYL